MQDEILKSRSTFQKKKSILCVLVCFLIVVFWFVFVYLTGICSFECIPDNNFLLLMAISVVNILCLSYIFSLLMILWEEAVMTNTPIRDRIVNCVDHWFYVMIFTSVLLIVALYFCCSWMDHGLYIYPQIMLLNILFTVLVPCLYNLVDYDEADVSFSQDSNKSIGAVWAIGAYMSYYELILPDLKRKIEDFENKKHIQIPVKKLIIICPLSCNVRGSLKECDRMSFVDHLEVLEVDQGGNVNRKYKNCVYGIKNNHEEDTFVVAEYASPLGTLWEKRLSMNKHKWKYHRDCVIQNLKDLLQNLPCIVLVYDDVSESAEPLSNALLSSVKQHMYR